MLTVQVKIHNILGNKSIESKNGKEGDLTRRYEQGDRATARVYHSGAVRVSWLPLCVSPYHTVHSKMQFNKCQ